MEKTMPFEKNRDTFLNFSVVFGVIAFVVLRIIYSSGELTPDSIQYFQQAQNFWEYKVNFPLGYSFLIKVISFFTGSFIIASKLINIFSYIGIVFFSYKKKFFFPHTLVVFSFYPFLNFYSLSLSEPVYYFFNYLIIYSVYKIIKDGFSQKLIFSLSVFFFILVSIRFSGIFVFVTTFLFLGFLTFRKKYDVKSYLFSLSFSLIGVFSYLILNYLYSGFLLGNRDHLHLEHENFIPFISRILYSTLEDFSFLKGIIHKGILHKVSLLNIFVGIFFVLVGFLIFTNKRRKTNFDFYLIFSSLGIFLSLLYSFYTTKIDDSIRIKSNVYLYLVLLIVFNLPKTTINYMKYFVIIILVINSFALIKHSENIKKNFPKYEALLCKTNDKTVEIIYKNYQNNKERNNASVLLFKAILIDKGYKVYDSERADPKVTNCHIKTSEIIR